MWFGRENRFRKLEKELRDEIDRVQRDRLDFLRIATGLAEQFTNIQKLMEETRTKLNQMRRS